MDYNVQLIDANKWSEMTVQELTEQRNRLYNRYDFLMSKKQNAAMIIQGLQRIENIIAQKANSY